MDEPAPFAAAAVLHRRRDSHCSEAVSVQPDAARQCWWREQTLGRADVLHQHIAVAMLTSLQTWSLSGHYWQLPQNL